MSASCSMADPNTFVTKEEFFEAVKNVSVDNHISHEAAFKLVEAGLVNMSRKDLVDFLVYVRAMRHAGVAVTFFDKTGVQWFDVGNVQCNKCMNLPTYKSIYESMYSYETDCCMKSKNSYWGEDEDLYPIIMDENHYCDKCFSPLYEFVDASYDSDYFCSCDEDRSINGSSCESDY